MIDDANGDWNPERLRGWLKERGKTRSWLASQLGIAPSNVNSWLRGDSSPGPRMREKLSEATGDDYHVKVEEKLKIEVSQGRRPGNDKQRALWRLLAALREERDWNWTQLADEVGVTKVTVYNWRNQGQVSHVMISKVRRTLARHGVSVEFEPQAVLELDQQGIADAILSLAKRARDPAPLISAAQAVMSAEIT